MLWLVRWSQIFFWVGAVLLIVEMIVMITTTIFETPLFTESQKTVLYIIGTGGALMFAWGSIVYLKSLLIDERGKRRVEKEKPGAGTPSSCKRR